LANLINNSFLGQLVLGLIPQVGVLLQLLQLDAEVTAPVAMALPVELVQDFY